jgi:hypothetical protein
MKRFKHHWDGLKVLGNADPSPMTPEGVQMLVEMFYALNRPPAPPVGAFRPHTPDIVLIPD